MNSTDPNGEFPSAADEALAAEQREIYNAQLRYPDPIGNIERRAELRDSGMEPDQIDATIRGEIRGRREQWQPVSEDRPSIEEILIARLDAASRREMSAALDMEMRQYFRALGRTDAEEAHRAGVSQADIVSGMVGVARIRETQGNTWEPDAAGVRVFVTPVRIASGRPPSDLRSDDPARTVRKGETIDIVAWRPDRPGKWSQRVGEALALGSVDSREIQIHRDPLEWFRSGAEGIVLLTRHEREQRSVLAKADSVIVSEPAQRETLRRVIADTHEFRPAAVRAPQEPVTASPQRGMAMRA